MTAQSDRWEEVHARATKRFDATWKQQEKIRFENLDDRKFYSIRGAQWDDEWGAQFENAPRIEVNKTHKEIIRIISEYRANRITVDFRPDDAGGDEETADGLDALYRADEEDYGAQEAYDTAFEEGIGGGMGAWRLSAEYEDEADPENDYQRICFEPITDADQRVFFGPSKRQDKRDAKYAWLLTPLAKEEFEDKYEGKASTDFDSWPRTIYDWVKEEVVWIAEYFEIEQKTTTKITLTHPLIQEDKQLIDPEGTELADLKAQGWKVSSTRDIKRPSVRKYTISGAEVLNEEVLPGPNIPIVVFYAKRWVIENVEYSAGHTRYAKDPQRSYNSQITSLTEIASISPFEKPIFDPDQMKGLADSWAVGNIARHPYALARALRNADGSIAATGPIGKVTPPQVPAALAALIQLSGNDIADLLGTGDQPDEIPANTSAQAIAMVHNRTDAKTFIYLDNFAKAMRRGGEIWLGIASEIYVEEGRVMTGLDDQKGQQAIALGEPAIAKSGEQIVRHDFSGGKFKVFVDVGPSSQSRKDATLRSLTGMAQMTSDQDLESVLTSLALMNMDGEGLDDVQKWIRTNLIRKGVVQPTEEEKKELAQQQQAAQQQPDPQVQLAAAKAADLAASADQRKADTMLKMAQAQAVGGPDAAPTPPDGLEQAHKVVQIRKTAAEAQNLETQTQHLPQKLAVEAANARAKLMAAAKQSAPQQ